MNSVVLVTGCSGFLGRHLVKRCNEIGLDVVGVDRNIEPNDLKYKKYIQEDLLKVEWKTVLENYKPSVVFHLAATASVGQSVMDPFGDFSKSLPVSARLISAMNKIIPESKLVYYSSAAVYGNPESLPISENAKIKPVSPYGLHKCLTERLIEAGGTDFGVRSICLRIFSAYGVFLKKQIFYDLNKKIDDAINIGNANINLWGTGDESRDFIHGRDVADVALLVANVEFLNDCEYINVASGIETKISDAASIYINVAKRNINIVFNGEKRIGDPQNWRADVSKLTNMGFKPKISLEEGLAEYFDWISRGNL